MATQLELAYMAGLFDGEGYIAITNHVRRNRPSKDYKLFCRVAMCNPYIPKFFELHFGGRVFTYKKENRRRVWSWQIANDPAMEFLQTVLPYLRLKKNEAELGIEFRERLQNVVFRGRNRLPDSEVAIREAQRILMSSLKDKTK